MAREETPKADARSEQGRAGTRKAASAANGRRTADSPQEARGSELREQLAQPTIPSVTTMVCLTCGAEQFFESAVPRNLKCPRCSSVVFRTFDTPTVRDEAIIAHLEEEARSIQYGDPSPQISPDEVRDLDAG